MLPEGAEYCNDPACVQGRVGNCNKHSHKPWKPKPLYGGNNHTHNTTAMRVPGGCASTGSITQVVGSSNGMTVPMTPPSHASQSLGPNSLASGAKAPSVAEEAEGPGTGPLDDSEQDCAGAARRLTQVMNWMRDAGHTGAMLRDFAHSDSCSNPACSPFCRMFRRVRRHVQGAPQHPCMLLRTYAVLLRMHVHSCNDEACGMRACPTLRNRHTMQSMNDQHQIGNLKQEDDTYDVDMPEH